MLRTYACSEVLNRRRQCYLALRIHARRDAIYIIIFGREGRYNDCKGCRLEECIRGISIKDVGLRGLIAMSTICLDLDRIIVLDRKDIDLYCRMIVLRINDRMGCLVNGCTSLLVCLTMKDLSGAMFISSYGKYGVKGRASIEAFQDFSEARSSMIEVICISGLRANSFS